MMHLVLADIEQVKQELINTRRQVRRIFGGVIAFLLKEFHYFAERGQRIFVILEIGGKKQVQVQVDSGLLEINISSIMAVRQRVLGNFILFHIYQGDH